MSGLMGDILRGDSHVPDSTHTADIEEFTTAAAAQARPDSPHSTIPFDEDSHSFTTILPELFIASKIKGTAPFLNQSAIICTDDSRHTLLSSGAEIQPSIFKWPSRTRADKSGRRRSCDVIVFTFWLCAYPR
jgi:hypothetical protein